jgi:hypothetical protein
MDAADAYGGFILEQDGPIETGKAGLDGNLFLGDALHKDLDVHFVVFSDVRIPQYKKKGKLTAELTQVLFDGCIKSTNQIVSRWLARR